MKQPLTIILGFTLCLCSCGKKQSANTGWSDTTPVNIMVVDNGDAPTERNYVGDISSEKEISVGFPLGGKLTKVYVKNGQHVTKGQLMATIDSTTAASLYATAMATLRQAEDAYGRLKAVHKEGGISDVKWVEMETNMEKARQTAISAKKHLEDCTIRAPFNGVVSCPDHQVGEDLRPGEAYARVLDINKLQVSFSVPEQEIHRIDIGDTATATVPSLDGRVLTLRVSNKSLVANPLGHTYRVDASITSGDENDLLPDMVTKVRTHHKTSTGTLVPSNCIHTMPAGQMVWVIENGVAQQRKVTVGDFLKCNVLITEGLESGDTVVTEGYQKLYTGAKVSF